MKITSQMIDSGARYLRETQQAGKRLTPWESTPKATKSKWLYLSQGVLEAARATLPAPPEDDKERA